tara:strand:- start:2656 stop:3252 length:597 start_codon:yes stop_codon:yes gene_type:complete
MPRRHIEYKKKYIIDTKVLKALRKKHFATQSKFVKHVNSIYKDDPKKLDFVISLSHYKQIESQPHKLVKDTVLEVFAKVFDCTVANLIYSGPEENKTFDIVEQAVQNVVDTENHIVGTWLETLVDKTIRLEERIERQTKLIEKQNSEIQRLNANINIVLNRERTARKTNDDKEVISIPKEDIIKYLLKNNMINITHTS